MNIFKFLGLKKKVAKTPREILHLWEDDYLMLELLPQENLEFVKAETARINDFGQEHFNGQGFTAVTEIGEKPIKTIEKLIEISDVVEIMSGVGLSKMTQFHMQGVGVIEGGPTLGFGTSEFAIMCERQNNLLKNIWLAGHTNTEEEKQKLTNALLLFGQTFGFIAVNWFSGEYYNLVEESSIPEFLEAV